MLEAIHFKNVGPAPEMKMNLAPRLNLITGDNGLGKTLLLDGAWWALTRTWPLTWGGKGIVPEKEDAAIEWVEQRGDVALLTKSTYDFGGTTWEMKQKQAPRTDTRGGGLVVYLRVDGGISVHDPLRTGEDFRMPFGQITYGKSNSFQFLKREIWDGLALTDGSKLVCEGLVRDIVRWAVEQGNTEFDQIAALVEQLAGDEKFRLTRKVARVYVEVESHLHPKWQRTILPSLLRALSQEANLQVIATTHSPLVLASIEPVFDVDNDKLFLLDLENHVVALHEKPWAMQGDVINWLVSDTFGLQQARSAPAEKAIEAAEAWMRGDTAALPPNLVTKEAIHEELGRLLPGHDPFWPRWVVSYEKAGVIPEHYDGHGDEFGGLR